MVSARTRPLEVRPGTAYTCHGDGLCCTDVHVLGPLSRREAAGLRRLSPGVVVRSEDVEGPALRFTAAGACTFLGEWRCELHARHGAHEKPSFCRRFPLYLTATPAGGRVSLMQRCPCRTLGDRPALTPAEAARSLCDRGGRLVADHHVEGDVTFGRRARVSFDDWCVYEARLLARLDAGEPIEPLLEARPFWPLPGGRRWSAVERELRRDAAADPTRFGAAMAWFAAGIAAAKGRAADPPRDRRPWAPAFDRAEARPGAARAPESLYRDWVADHVWGLAWATEGSFHRCRHDLATRLAVARAVARLLEAEGARPDRAAAESLAVVELVGICTWWAELLETLG